MAADLGAVGSLRGLRLSADRASASRFLDPAVGRSFCAWLHRPMAFAGANLAAVIALSLAGVAPRWLFAAYAVQLVECVWGSLRPATGWRPARIGRRQLLVSAELHRPIRHRLGLVRGSRLENRSAERKFRSRVPDHEPVADLTVALQESRFETIPEDVDHH